MSNQQISNPAFQGEKKSPVGFNLVNQVNAFTSIFGSQSLDSSTSEAIDKLILENKSSKKIGEEKVKSDVENLKNITSEVKSIQKQGAILTGERIYKAREILSSYGKDGETFTTWMKIAFKELRTAYNALAYYELYMEIRNPELQSKLKEMPHSAVYTLASRKGDLDKKKEIIEGHYSSKATEIKKAVEEAFPLRDGDKRKTKDSEAIGLIRAALIKLKKRRAELSKESLKEIGELRFLIDDIINDPSQIDIFKNSKI